MVALMAVMVMGLTSEAKTEDVYGRVIDAQGEPLPFVSVVLLTTSRASANVGTHHSSQISAKYSRYLVVPPTNDNFAASNENTK